MAQKTTTSTAEQVAQKAKPNWKPVPANTGQDGNDILPSAADAQTPELEALHRKYFGASTEALTSAVRAVKSKPVKKSKMVVMEPKNAVDARQGRKTVLVEDGKVIGEQG